ncbi:MAG TPA: 23S rRNA (pseudouridine(1915)-N(3))-methyltransferase RlmH [Bacillota bacterium]|jgi:23S rRNA (pseudouridine1915-N3)-methyltransferase|nr:23S rRNA (pseudouridine(1915)-N(3))-methyltransferase RlmH [Bacillota bacterium]HOL09962.1 23S rRNA (pseudouridine(1915)-N(3))-methyltransferase RlmH [Bacillota bacterium]HPO97961.1 23S rRNA (pseudouridine(1915)-N(3))-methyltransferase RlmH [Bacillota bacterium]
MALVRIIAVGKLKENYLKQAEAEYLKRLASYLKLEIKEIPDLPVPENASPAQEEQVKNGEGALIDNLILPKSYLVVLDIEGKQLTSMELARFLHERQVTAQDLTLVIGGSLGLVESIKAKANLRLSFSKLTFPHQLFRIMLLEQLYRACKINRGEKYHK